MPKDRVLFVCTDGARSQMAATILREHAADRFEGWCAALEPRPADHRTIQALRQHGMNAMGSWVYSLSAVRGEFRYDIGLDDAIEAPNWLGARILLWPFPDPVAGGTLAAFEQARDLIEATLFDWLTKFEERDQAPDESLPAHHLGGTAARTAGRAAGA